MRGPRILLALVLVAAPGCGGDDPPPVDVGVDAAAELGLDGQPNETIAPDIQPDQLAPDTLSPNTNFGEGCRRQGDCKPGSPDCLIFDNDSGRGICSKECTPDDPATPLLNEDNCPQPDYVCGEFDFGANVFHYCLKRCEPSVTSNPCPASSGTTCNPVSTRFSALEAPVCWYAACVDDTDCPVLSSTSCASNGECSALASDAFCDPVEGRCARPGNCTAGGLCGPHALGDAAAKVGAPCTSDFECPNNGFCIVQDDAAGALSPGYRNGYCTVRYCRFASTLSGFACPAGSTCHNLFFGGLCHSTCDPADAGTCRGAAVDHGGDYECYGWNNLFIGGVAVTDQPVCQSSLLQTCDSLGTSLDCTSLGTTNNPHSMGCRDRFTGAPRPTRDPTGVCLDDTASGIFDPIPDGGVDSAVVDVGVDTVAPADGGATDGGGD